MMGWIVAAVILTASLVIFGKMKGSQGQDHQPWQIPGQRAAAPPQMPRPSQPQRIQPDETGPMIYFANDRYGSRDKEYIFNYKLVNGSWRAYILKMPSLRGRSDSSGTIHRLSDQGNYYICWDSRVETLQNMQTISRHWADSIQEYIATGRTFG